MNRARLGHSLPAWASDATWKSLALDRAAWTARQLLAGSEADDWYALDRLRASDDIAVREILATLPWDRRPWSKRVIARIVADHFGLESEEGLRHRLGTPYLNPVTTDPDA